MTHFAPDIAHQKAQLRTEMKARRAQLDERARSHAACLLCDSLGRWLASRAETRIALYLSRPFEIGLDALALELLGAGKTVCAPRVDLARNRMEFWRLPNLEACERGPWSVREPPALEMVRPQIVLVPGLAFDKSGHRLGTGGGWYDRVLSEIPTKIGVVFDRQIVAHVPTEAHDVRMNWVASEAGLVECS